MIEKLEDIETTLPDGWHGCPDSDPDDPGEWMVPIKKGRFAGWDEFTDAHPDPSDPVDAAMMADVRAFLEAHRRGGKS